MEQKGLALVTGASSGIGREMASLLAEEGYRLILVARRKDQMESLARKLQVPCDVYPCDLSVRSQVLALAEYMKECRPDIVVNNAGFGVFGDVDGTRTANEAAMIDVNVTALHLLTAAAVSYMKKRGSGRILNVASSAGLMPGGPHMAGYYATKAYVVSLTGAVAQELREAGSAVTISALCPGPVDTEFNHVAGVRFALRGIDAGKCAKAGLVGMKAGKTFIVPEGRIRAAVFAMRFLPRKLALQIISRQQMKKNG